MSLDRRPSKSHITLMPASTDFAELKGLRVEVERVIYQPDFDGPADRPYCFVYHIRIRNGSDRAVAIKARKWVVTNARGEITAVEGDGVVGQCPELKPGESFRYKSFHLLETSAGFAEGSYLGLDDQGRRILTRIPRFEMDASRLS